MFPATAIIAWAMPGLLSLANNLDDYPLCTLAVELGIENPLPGAQIELSFCNRQSNGLMHEQTLQVRVAVIFAGLVMAVVLAKRSQLFQPLINVLYEPRLMIVHVHGSCDVHGGNKRQALFHAALTHRGFHLGSDVDVFAMILGIEGQVVGVGFHSSLVFVGFPASARIT